MACIKWSQPILSSFWWNAIPAGHSPQRNLGGNPKIDPHFPPIAKPHLLNTLTSGPPPIYWLGISRWCPGPLCVFHSVCVCFFLAFTPFLLLLRCLVFLCVLVCVYPLWHGGYVGFWAYVFFLLSLLRLGIVQAKAFANVACWAFVLSLFFMTVSLLAYNLAILLHRVCHDFVLPLLLIALASLLAGVLAISAHWPINSFLWASLAHSSLVILHGFVGHYSCHV